MRHISFERLVSGFNKWNLPEHGGLILPKGCSAAFSDNIGSGYCGSACSPCGCSESELEIDRNNYWRHSRDDMCVGAATGFSGFQIWAYVYDMPSKNESRKDIYPAPLRYIGWWMGPYMTITQYRCPKLIPESFWKAIDEDNYRMRKLVYTKDEGFLPSGWKWCLGLTSYLCEPSAYSHFKSINSSK